MIPGDIDGLCADSSARLWDILEEYGDKVDDALGLSDPVSHAAAMTSMVDLLVDTLASSSITSSTIVDLVQPSIQTDQVVDGLVKALLILYAEGAPDARQRWSECITAVLDDAFEGGAPELTSRTLVNLAATIRRALPDGGAGPWVELFGRLSWLQLRRGTWTLIGMLPVALGLSKLPLNLAPPPAPLLPLVEVCVASLHRDPKGCLQVLEALSRGVLPAYLDRLPQGRRREIEERILVPLATSEALAAIIEERAKPPMALHESTGPLVASIAPLVILARSLMKTGKVKIPGPSLAMALAIIGDAGTVKMIEPLVRHQDRQRRLDGIGLLEAVVVHAKPDSKVRGKAFGLVYAAMGDPDEDVVIKVIDVVEREQGLDAVEELVRLLVEAPRDWLGLKRDIIARVIVKARSGATLSSQRIDDLQRLGLSMRRAHRPEEERILEGIEDLVYTFRRLKARTSKELKSPF